MIDARLYGLENAGLGRYTMNLVSELAKLDKKNLYTILLRRKYFKELKLPKNWQKIEADFRHYSLTEQVQLPMIVKRNSPDLVHFPHFNVSLLLNTPFVVTIHDLLMHQEVGKKATTLPLPVYWTKRLGYKAVFNQAVKKAAKIIVPSQAVKKEVTDYYQIDDRKIVVTYEGVDEKFFETKKTKVPAKYQLPKEYFLYVGSAYPHKNLERLVEAVKKVGTNLVIVSSRNVFVKRLEKLIAKYDAQENVLLPGFIPDEDLIPIYQLAVGFVYSSLSEGFGLQGLEAMAAKTLVLASDIPVFNEVYQDYAFYFNPCDSTSITKAMQDALEMSITKRRVHLTKAKAFAKKYSWPQMAKETLQVYEGPPSLRANPIVVI